MIYLGLNGNKGLPGALSALHIIVWKFVIIAFTRVETENARFNAQRIWWDSVRRFQVRREAYRERERISTMRRAARGGCPFFAPQHKDRIDRELEPLGWATDDEIEWSLAYSRMRRQVDEEMRRRDRRGAEARLARHQQDA
jgi:hypothetical protein